jgi:serine phosphatase RsbU (regulator of sigma subunit)
MAAGRRGIGFKLTLAVMGLLLAALGTSTGLARYIISLTLEKNLRERMDEGARSVKSAFDLRVAELEVFADSFANDGEFQRVTSTQDFEQMTAQVKSFAERAHLDSVVAVYRDEQGKEAVLASIAPPGMAASKFSSTPVFQAVVKKPDTLAEPAIIDGRLFLQAVAPVNFFGRVIGFLVLSREFTPATAKDLKARIGSDLGIIVGKTLISSTVKVDVGELSSLLTTFGDGKVASVASFSSGTDSYFATAVPISNNAGTVGLLMAARSQASLVEARKKTLRDFISVSVVLAAVGVAMGLFLSRRIANPIAFIEQKFRQIHESGDLALRIPESFGDEIGSMAKTFNQMQGRVQELHQKLADSERRMRQELEMAAVVQEMLFPPLPPESPAIDLSSFVATSSETGGDWYGFVVNPRANTTTVIIGDVTGHGVPAALVTAIIHGFFRAIEATSMGANIDWIADALHLAPAQRTELANHISKGLPLTNLLQILNRVLLESTKGSLFLTLFVSTLHHDTRILEYVNAAHNLPFVLRTSGNRPEVGVLPAAPANRLGDAADLKLAPRRVQLSKGDSIIWYTDGLIECENEKGDEYGQKRLTRLIARSAGMEAPAMKDRIVEDAYKFFGNRPRKDDITLVVGRIK